MNLWKMLVLPSLLSFICLVASAQQSGTGGLRGKVKVDTGSPSGVSVTLGQSDKEVHQVETNRKGEFSFNNLKPGSYSLTFRKPGLAVGKLEDVEIAEGKIRELKSGLIMHVDE